MLALCMLLPPYYAGITHALTTLLCWYYACSYHPIMLVLCMLLPPYYAGIMHALTNLLCWHYACSYHPIMLALCMLLPPYYAGIMHALTTLLCWHYACSYHPIMLALCWHNRLKPIGEIQPWIYPELETSCAYRYSCRSRATSIKISYYCGFLHWYGSSPRFTRIVSIRYQEE